jgi:hypothetical protein
MNKRQIIASLIKIANELDNNGMNNEADALTNVAERFEDNRTPVEKIASKKIKLLQDKLRQIISRSYQASKDGKMLREDDVQAILLQILFEKDLGTFLRNEEYKTGARLPAGIIQNIVHAINQIKEDPNYAFENERDVDNLLRS